MAASRKLVAGAVAVHLRALISAVWVVEVVMASPVSSKTCLEVVVSIAVISLLCREVCNRIWKPLFPSIYTQPCLAAR